MDAVQQNRGISFVGGKEISSQC